MNDQEATMKTDNPAFFRRKILKIALLLLFFLSAVGVARYRGWLLVSTDRVNMEGWKMEIVDTEAKRLQGLSGRSSLGEKEAMLFVFDKPGLYPFWMKDMHFPLDIIWLREKKIVDIVTLSPPDSASIIPASHIPFAQADQVLEINAGEAKKLGLKRGSELVLPVSF